MTSYSRIKFEYKDDLEWIQVVDLYPEAHRYLQFESSIQGVMGLADHRVPVLEYIGLMARAASLCLAEPEQIWIGGLGTCSLLHAIQTQWKTARVHTVESNHMVHELARRFFRLDPGAEVTIGDLRETLQSQAFDRCDLLLVDCYSAFSIPQHLTTLEFWYLVRQKLAPGGLLISNLWSSGCNKICGDQVRTLLEVFDELALVSCREDENIIAITGKAPSSSWPETITWKGRTYPLTSLSRRKESKWPEFMEGCRVLEDDNVAVAFEAVGYPI